VGVYVGGWVGVGVRMCGGAYVWRGGYSMQYSHSVYVHTLQQTVCITD